MRPVGSPAPFYLLSLTYQLSSEVTHKHLLFGVLTRQFLTRTNAARRDMENAAALIKSHIEQKTTIDAIRRATYGKVRRGIFFFSIVNTCLYDCISSYTMQSPICNNRKKAVVQIQIFHVKIFKE